MDDDEDFTDGAAESFAALFADLPAHRNRRFRPVDALVLGILTLHSAADAVTNSLAAAYNAAASHANYKRDLEDMQEEAALEIESLITGEENG